MGFDDEFSEFMESLMSTDEFMFFEGVEHSKNVLPGTLPVKELEYCF